MVAQETANGVVADGANTHQEALALTVALLARVPLPLVPDQAADLAVCIFREVERQLSRTAPSAAPAEAGPCDAID